MDREKFDKAFEGFGDSGYIGPCEVCKEPATKFLSQVVGVANMGWIAGQQFALSDSGKSKEEIHLFCDEHAPKTALIIEAADTPTEDSPDSLSVITDLAGNKTSFLKLRSLVIPKFGIRLQSTGDYAARAQTRIVMQTINVLPAEPLLVFLDQFILTPFTGDGQFDLVERDASDVDVFDGEGNKISGGESEVTLATHTGFAQGIASKDGFWSRQVKPHTVNKIYSVVFVPGATGDGIFSIRVEPLRSF